MTLAATCVGWCAAVWASVARADLPDAYLAVAYIQSDGTQYIDSGVAGNGGVPQIDMKVQLLGTSDDTWAFGYYSADAAGFLNFGINSGHVRLRVLNTILDTIPTDTAVHEYALNTPSGTYVDGTLYASPAIAGMADTGTITYGIFDRTGNGGKKGVPMRLYSLAIRIDGTVVRSFTPCLRKSDFTPGLYDSVGGQFYVNTAQGAMPFSFPYPVDTLVFTEYLQASGSQYIRTGLVSGGKVPRIRCRFQYLAATTTFFLGAWNNTVGTLCGTYENTFRFRVDSTLNKDNAFDTAEHALDMNTSEGTYLDGVPNATPAGVRDSPANTYEWLLFGRNQSNTPECVSSLRLWHCAVWLDGTLERCFLPCRSLATGEGGFFDSVTGVFFGNMGQGAFTCGPDVPGIRVNAGTGAVECRVSVTNAAGEATLSLDGGATWIAGTNGWFAVGSVLAVTVKPPSPGERRTWLRTPSEASLGADGTSFSVAFLTKPFDARLDSFTPTHVWTGAAGTTAFDTAENWTNATADAAVAAPGAASDVFVPVGCTMNPIATVPFAVKSFRIGALTNEAGTATFTADTACTNEVSGDLAVYPGGMLTHTGPEASPTKRLAFAVGGDMTVCTNGSIDVRGKGYTPKHWPGYSSATGALSQNGGLHARNYGSAFYPVTHGSGGGWSGKTGEVGDGRGSGVVYLSVAGTLTIDGTITSDWYVNKDFCGAGGSIQLHAASYAGRGSVTANGAKGSSSDSADGGRIALYVGATGDAFAGTVTAYGGGPTATRPGACGTIYRCRAGEDGHLLLDARGRPYVIPTPLAEWSLDGTDARLASLTVTNGAVARVEPGITLRITESWDARGGTVTNAAGSHVVFEPASTGRVHGVNSFYDVSCAASGKALVFGTGAAESVSVRDGGTIDFHGAEGAKLALLPDGAGVWSLAVSKAAACNLQYLAVSNSNASAGTSLTAVSSEDLGGNTFWSFPKPISPGDPIEWTGAVSADWFDPGNWKDKYDQPRAPVDTDRVIIPSGRARNPIIGSGKMQINALTVSEGARLTLQACTATVTNALAVNGTLALTGGGKLSCGGDVSFAAAAALEAGTSTIALTGSGSQTVSAPGVAFCHLHVTKSGGAVTFVRGFSARELRASVASSEVALTFGAGETFAVSDLILAGELAGEPGLVLESGQSGSPWYLNATGVRFVSAVAVSDSDASGGKPIPADALSTGADTRNVNWTFSGSSKLWTGAADKFFDNAANWSPVGAPGADANVLIMAAKDGTLDLEIRRATSVANFSFLAYEATATLLVSNAVTVTGETKFGGNVTVTMKTEEAWTTGGDYTLETGVTLTHTGPLNPPKYRAAVSAGGSIAIASGALVTADGKGRVPKAAYWGTIWNTGSHGGKAEQKCYGSVFWPVLHGSCGGNQTDGKYAYGGGVIRLAAQGDVTVDGKVTANGLYDSFSGAGGSVWITCGGALKGSGAIQSIGGVCSTSVQTYCGAGGRISVQQGAATRPFVGLISARGCKGNNAANSGGAGTVYFSCGGNPLAGELLLSNNGYTVLGTQLPMADDGDPARAYRDVRVVVTNAAVLEVTAPLTLRDVDLAHAGCRIDLGTNTLTVLDSKHRDGRRWAAGATVTCTTNATDGVYGKIVWKSQGTRIVVR